MSALRLLIHFLRLGRPLFLLGGFIFHGLGVIIALYEGAPLNLPALLWGQIAVTSIQSMTHYANDYFDLAADLANETPTYWTGGSRVLPQGHLRPAVALAAAICFALVAVFAAAILTFAVRTGPLTVPLLALALFLAWEYSAPPLRLHSRGLGEATVAVLVPVLTPLVGYYLQAGRISLLPLLATFPLACFQFVMLLAIEFPDAAGDAAAGKDTLVVRLGGARADRLLRALLLLPYPYLPLAVAAGLPLPVALGQVLFSAPLTAWLLWRLRGDRWSLPGWWSWLSFFAVVLVIGSAAMTLLLFSWLWLAR